MLKSQKLLYLSFLFVVPSVSFSVEPCDTLGALEADPQSAAPSVSFQEIIPTNLITACTIAINKADEDLPRFLLQRGRGFLRLGDGSAAMADIQRSHEMGYSAATFGLATAYYLGDDVTQDFERARALFELAYEKGVRWSARGLSILYANEAYEYYDPEISNRWATRFEYEVPIELNSSPVEIDRIIDIYQQDCLENSELDIDFEDGTAAVKLSMSAENFYDISITPNGKMATVVYAAFSCPDMGYMWSGSGGSPYYIIVGSDIFEGWGGMPYSLRHDDTVHVILPRAGGACDGSDELIPSNASACHGIANWDESLQGFNSIGNQLPIWERD